MKQNVLCGQNAELQNVEQVLHVLAAVFQRVKQQKC
jgi:hypothetical protein